MLDDVHKKLFSILNKAVFVKEHNDNPEVNIGSIKGTSVRHGRVLVRICRETRQIGAAKNACHIHPFLCHFLALKRISIPVTVALLIGSVTTTIIVICGANSFSVLINAFNHFR
ncbi:MAG: hypothetical protein GY777_24995 [Candidatus Brocadiaceae bacterium]|nr:hypothetical protein [Candidatus Brocadiaceae bacterium]